MLVQVGGSGFRECFVWLGFGVLFEFVGGLCLRWLLDFLLDLAGA